VPPPPFNRERQRTNISGPKSISYRYTYNHGGVAYGTGSWANWGTYWEKILDVHRVPRPKPGTMKYQVLPVEHVRFDVVTYPRPDFRVNFQNGTWGITKITSDQSGWMIPVETVLALRPSPVPDSYMQDHGLKAFEALSSQVPTEVSIANFFWELREWQELIPTFKENLRKTKAGGYLNFSFGWKPLVSDLQKLENITSTVTRRLEWLRRTYGQETLIGWSDEKIDSTIPSTIISNHGDSSIQLVRTGLITKRRTNGYLTHRLEGLDSATAELRAFAAALGLNNPVKIAWNALPYSFVVDWLTNISGLLARISVQPFVGEWNLRGVSSSQRTLISFELRQRSVLNQWENPNGNYDTVVGNGTYEYYWRGPGIPVTMSVLTSSGLTPQQQMLSLALLAK